MRRLTAVPLLICALALAAGPAVASAAPAAASAGPPARQAALITARSEGLITARSGRLITARSAGADRVAPAVVLVNQPASSVCVGRTFRVGVWYQRFSGGSRAYRVAVYAPGGRRVLYRHGQAPSAHWKFWKVRASRAGKYRTVYSGHWKSPTAWTNYKATTRARRCS